MDKAEVQCYQWAKKQRCVSCDRIEKIGKRLVIWHNQQVVGDLELCELCLEAILKIINSEEVIEEWKFTKGCDDSG